MGKYAPHYLDILKPTKKSTVIDVEKSRNLR